MSRLSALLPLLVLAACARAPAPVPDAPIRDTSRQVYATAAFDPARIAGEWRQVADVTAHPGCAPGRMNVTETAGGMAIDWQLCLNGQARSGQGALRLTGPGRLSVPGSPADWWVLWADADNRTLVIGTPSGAFGFVLDRAASLPADRAKAARDILAWNGYDTGLWR